MHWVPWIEVRGQKPRVIGVARVAGEQVDVRALLRRKSEIPVRRGRGPSADISWLCVAGADEPGGSASRYLDVAPRLDDQIADAINHHLQVDDVAARRDRAHVVRTVVLNRVGALWYVPTAVET